MPVPCGVLTRSFHVLMKKSGPSCGQGFPGILFLLSASGVATVSGGAAVVLSSLSLPLQPGLGLPHFPHWGLGCWDLRRSCFPLSASNLAPKRGHCHIACVPKGYQSEWAPEALVIAVSLPDAKL